MYFAFIRRKKGEFTNINVCLSVNHQFRDHEDQKLVSSGVALVYCFQNSFMKAFATGEFHKPSITELRDERA